LAAERTAAAATVGHDKRPINRLPLLSSEKKAGQNRIAAVVF
jgi:hypothetical protein